MEIPGAEADSKLSGRGRLIVGVTGGIGSGKSTAAAMFEEHGAGVIDTDAIALELTQPGQPTLQRIAQRFGNDYLGADGRLDRAKLRALVFSDPVARADLEAILHPSIGAEVRSRVQQNLTPYVLILIPLLAETGAYRELLKRILVIDCDERLQIQRAMDRSGLTVEEVRSIIAAQASRSARLALADDIIVNDRGLAELHTQVAALDARYRQLASEQ
ncbi:MAG: dephospho-CoA kinase [Proteobacteria bacterium]|nr:MAG: dephospho-CoA kinase [Pseudomonadota bacterium]